LFLRIGFPSHQPNLSEDFTGVFSPRIAASPDDRDSYRFVEWQILQSRDALRQISIRWATPQRIQDETDTWNSNDRRTECRKSSTDPFQKRTSLHVQTSGVVFD
jgi:hypothetical protein